MNFWGIYILILFEKYVYELPRINLLQIGIIKPRFIILKIKIPKFHDFWIFGPIINGLIGQLMALCQERTDKVINSSIKVINIRTKNKEIMERQDFYV